MHPSDTLESPRFPRPRSQSDGQPAFSAFTPPKHLNKPQGSPAAIQESKPWTGNEWKFVPPQVKKASTKVDVATEKPTPSFSFESLAENVVETINDMRPDHLCEFIRLLDSSCPDHDLSFDPPSEWFDSGSLEAQDFVRRNLIDCVKIWLEPPAKSDMIVTVMVALINLERTTRFGLDDEELAKVKDLQIKTKDKDKEKEKEKEQGGAFKREWGKPKVTEAKDDVLDTPSINPIYDELNVSARATYT